MDTKEGLVTIFKFEYILVLDAIISRHKEGLGGLASKDVLRFFGEVFHIDVLHLCVVVSRSFPYSLSTFWLTLEIFGFNSEKSRVLLVPVCFNWDSVCTGLVLHEFVHVNVVHKEFSIGDSD